MVKKKRRAALLGLAAFLYIFLCLSALALAAPSGGGYLAGYENLDPKPTGVSWWSTIAYLVSLFAVFAFVVGMAYLVSRYIGGHFAKAASGGGGQMLAHLPLGPNRSVCVVELAGRVYVLGVTEQSIALIREIEDPEEIERLHTDALGHPDMASNILAGQFGSLSDLAKRIPSLFKDGAYRR